MSRHSRQRPRPFPAPPGPARTGGAGLVGDGAEFARERAPVRTPTRGGRSAPPAGVSARRLIPPTALLPLRAFLGGTFLYAGLDKLIDPSFFDASSPAGIHAQLEGFARTSPVAFLVKAVALPFPNEVGLLIALGEIAIGLGALSGLLFRAAAAGGAALSFLFWLTASWTTHPYYYGPDLPYAMGWVTLAAAGSGELLVLGPWLERRLAGVRSPAAPALSPERRTFLQLAVMAAGSIAVALVVPPVRALVFGPATATAPGSSPAPALPPSTGGTGTPSSPPVAVASVPPSAASAAGALEIGTVSELASTASLDFVIPTSSNPQIPGGDPGVLVKLANGSYVAFDAVCTHAGCTVSYDPQYALLLCPCHGAAFDPTDNARPVAGPTSTPLLKLPISVNKSTGAITIQA